VDFSWPPIYHLPGNVISAALSLVYTNLQPEYELPSSIRFGQFQKFQKNQLGALSSPDDVGKNFCTGSEFLFVATCVSDLTLLASLTSGIITIFPNWGPRTIIRGYPRESRVVLLNSADMISY